MNEKLLYRIRRTQRRETATPLDSTARQASPDSQPGLTHERSRLGVSFRLPPI